ncbi:hypothetical protein RRF57_005942 [Xylaria bambusicola]|uniref:Uncharacterized protein n=1 Tax=Xylaria bambusicola TaxID=326684 RepID=A0AAN7Z571_9PEZI
MGEDDELLEDSLGRALNYGRIPATSLETVWCNLDIGNMGMSELVEFEGCSSVQGGHVDGVVHTLRNRNWDMEEAFGKRLYEFVKQWDRSGNSQFPYIPPESP